MKYEDIERRGPEGPPGITYTEKLNGVKGPKGAQGISGPTGITNFEIPDGMWTQEHANLNSLCIKVLNFLNEHSEVASHVEITKDMIKSSISNIHGIRPQIVRDGDAKHYHCPICGKHLFSTKDCRICGSKTNYCSNCGQKIDWSTENIETYWPHQ